MYKIHSKEDFTLFCSIYDSYSNLIVRPEDIEETEKSFVYNTTFRYEIANEQYLIQIEWLKDYQEITIHCLDERGDILDEQPLEVCDDLYYAVKESRGEFIRQKFHLDNAKGVSDQFDALYRELKGKYDNFEYVEPNQQKELLTFADQSILLLKQTLTMTSWTAKEAITDMLLDISSKTISLFAEIHNQGVYLAQTQNNN